MMTRKFLLRYLLNYYSKNILYFSLLKRNIKSHRKCLLLQKTYQYYIFFIILAKFYYDYENGPCPFLPKLAIVRTKYPFNR